jgi:hypothetical protein
MAEMFSSNPFLLDASKKLNLDFDSWDEKVNKAGFALIGVENAPQPKRTTILGEDVCRNCFLYGAYRPK